MLWASRYEQERLDLGEFAVANQLVEHRSRTAGDLALDAQLERGNVEVDPVGIIEDEFALNFDVLRSKGLREILLQLGFGREPQPIGANRLGDLVDVRSDR